MVSYDKSSSLIKLGRQWKSLDTIELECWKLTIIGTDSKHKVEESQDT